MADEKKHNGGHEGLTVRETQDARGNKQYAVYDRTGLCEVSTTIRGLSARARQAWARQQGASDAEIEAAGENLPKF